MAAKSTPCCSLKENLEQQLDEIETLQCIYSQPGEFFIEQQIVDRLTGYVVHGQNDYPKCVECDVHLTVENNQSVTESEFDIQVKCRLTNEYPTTQYPEVHIHSDSLTRNGQDSLNVDLQSYITTELVQGDACLMLIIEWACVNAPNYYTPSSGSTVDETDTVELNEFCRMWLYMHHIYSKTKRHNILSLASELDLTGFCLPGKPGVVCIEGTSGQTKQFYDVLRRWNWKSITCRKREVTKGVQQIDSERKIVGFKELFFDTHGQRSNHMDLGQFREYLKTHNLEYMFKELFGVTSNNA